MTIRKYIFLVDFLNLTFTRAQGAKWDANVRIRQLGSPAKNDQALTIHEGASNMLVIARQLHFQFLFAAIFALLVTGCERASPAPPPADLTQNCPAVFRGEVMIAPGSFTAGTPSRAPEEGPARQESVAAFWIDRTEVTNGEFAAFVAATHYVTLAERPVRTIGPDGRHITSKPASIVFVGARNLDNNFAWWKLLAGADWRHPAGPHSSIQGREDWPVVHVAFEDALAYARWKGRDLPSEAEWEYAARGGIEGATYEWGDQPQNANEPAKANIWQGIFPLIDSGRDGFKAQTARVGCFAANAYGLYDMTGNVWEWTKDFYPQDFDDQAQATPHTPSEAPGARDSPDTNRPEPAQRPGAHHILKGGSFLCAENFCQRYRPAARQPGPGDSGASHIGFRTVRRVSSP